MSSPVYDSARIAGRGRTTFGDLRARLGRERSLHLMVLPSLVVVIVIHYFAMYGMVIAFKRYDIFQGILASPWARNGGFEHFIDFFRSPNAFRVLRNTVVIALLKLAFLSLPPMILAILLNEIRVMAFKRVSQTISYLPHFISWVVVGGIIYDLLNPSRGLLNHLLVSTGLTQQPIDFISTDGYFWPLIVLSHLWKEVGWASILYLAVIATIDTSVYEAANIDGAGRTAKIRFITWPHLKGVFMILFILHSGKIMSGYGDTFDQVYVLGTIANRRVSDILDTYVLRIGLENLRFSFATAVSMFKSVLNLGLLLGANYLSKRLTDKSLF